MPLWRFLVGYVALLSFAPVAFMPNQALFSKEVAGSRHQALLASLLSVADSLGAILGPLWMGAAASGGGGGDDDDDGGGGDDDVPTTLPSGQTPSP